MPFRRPTTSLPFDRRLFHPGQRVAVAISGGADSVALLRTLHAANSLPRDGMGIGLAAVHVHHGLRGEEADRDQRFVQALCSKLAVPFTVRAVNTSAHAATAGETLEEAARTLRYAAFQEIIAAREVDAVATAHTADDQAETVLMKLLRGAWTEGLAGIFPIIEVNLSEGRSGHILRPFLGVDRTEIELYLRAIDQEWVEDASNQEQVFTRNRMRHQLLPLLRDFNPSLNATLSNLAELARDEETYWRRELDRVELQIVLSGRPVRGGGRANSTSPGDMVFALEIERLRALPLALQRRLVRATARRLGVSLSFSETARLLALSGLIPAVPNVSSKAGSLLTLAGGLTAERSIREIRLYRSAAPESRSPFASRPKV